MRSASMGRKSIPNWRRVNFLTTTRFSRRLRQSCDGGCCDCCGFGWLARIEEEISNLEPRTVPASSCSKFEVQRSMFEVRGLSFFSFVPRRVMGAWWPSRSSKPLSARSTGRGMFDSYPLRHFHLRFTIYELRLKKAGRAAPPAQPLVNPKKGGGCHVGPTAP